MSTHDSPGAGQGAAAPDFDLVPLRSRRDGWTAERQRAFIAALYATRSVTRAAQAVGKSRETAYRLRARPGAASFAAAWDAALASVQRGHTNIDLLWHRAFYGTMRPIRRGGKEVGTLVRPDNKALLSVFDRFDRLARTSKRRERSQ